MDIQFRICQDCNGVLTITDETSYPNSEEFFRDFKYEDTLTINIVTLEEVDNPQLVAVTYSTHTTQLDEISIPLSKDGLYNITHLIVPTLEWYKKQREQKFNKLSKFKEIFISDGKNLYQVIDGQYEMVDPLSLITQVNLDATTIHKKQEITFLTCFLWKCYINLALEALNELISKSNGNKIQKCGNEDKDIIFKRDFVWSTIQVINYLIDACKLEEAQKILEEVVSCNGFCFSNSQSSLRVNNKQSCGCHQ